LSVDEGIEFANHLRNCDECRSWVAVYGVIDGALESEQNARSFPDGWIDEGVRLYRSFTPESSPSPSRIYASMVEDSLWNASRGLRSASVRERRLKLESSRFEIHVVLDCTGRHLRTMTGQLMAIRPEDDRLTAEVSIDGLVGGQTFRTETNEFGEFLMEVGSDLNGSLIELTFRFQEEPCLVALVPC
jgi:hypothetical protein